MPAQRLAALTALREVATGLTQAAAASFSDEQATIALALVDGLRARFLPPASSAQAASPLLQLPGELLSVILCNLDIRDLARLAATCRSLCRDAPTPPVPPRQIGPVEAELRRRAEARGLAVGSSLPEGAPSWVPYLLKSARRDAQRRQAPLAVGTAVHSVFVDTEGRLLTCGRECDGELVLGHAVGPGTNPDVLREIDYPTPVPSMQDRRIISVASGPWHCLALSAQGEVYSWGYNDDGQLGHADLHSRAVPSRIESLSRVERIAAGLNSKSAAVDEDGQLFTWGAARFYDVDLGEYRVNNDLGYELDSSTAYQLTPKRVDALSQDRVVSLALGNHFALVVTDPGAVFSFGSQGRGVLGHGSPAGQVLPRRIEALTRTGRRFIDVAAGVSHALALTEDGALYGWGDENNGHGRVESTPQRVVALIGQPVKLVNARQTYSCAVTEKGELFTWGGGSYALGHEVNMPQATPKRVEGLGGARVAAVVIGAKHMLAADEDGVVWAVGDRRAFGLGASAAGVNVYHRAFGFGALAAGVRLHVLTPTPIPALRVRVLKSP